MIARALAPTLLMAAAALTHSPARAQPGPDDGVTRAAERLAAAAEAATEGRAGRIVLRPRLGLPEGAPHGLAAALLEPARARLAERFDAAHVAVFGGLDQEAGEAARRLGYDLLLDVEARAAGGFFVMHGTLLEGGEARARFRHQTRLDAALRRYTGFPPRLTDEDVRAQTLLLPTYDVAAVAVHDLGGDGRTELVVVRPDGVRVYRLEPIGRRLRAREVGRSAWPADARRAAVPRRRLVASARPDGDGVALRTSDLAPGLRVSLVGDQVEVRVVEGPCPDDRYPMGGGCAELVQGRDFYDQILTRADATQLEAPGNFFAHVFGRFADREGGAATVEALVTPHGRMAVRLTNEVAEGAPERAPRSVGAVGYGAALAMTDLDFDGAPELLASTASQSGEGDALVLMRAYPRGALHVLWRSDPTTGPIFAAAAGDVDDDGLDELIAVEEPLERRGGARLWIVR